jgi:hypothetical protein
MYLRAHVLLLIIGTENIIENIKRDWVDRRTREAVIATRNGCVVIILAQQPTGRWKQVDVVRPQARGN